MRTIEIARTAASARVAATSAVLGSSLALTEARTAGVSLFERRTPMHCVLFGRSRLELDGVVRTFDGPVAIPAGARHRIVEIGGEHGCVAYLDARRYGFDEVARLAERWHGFVPGRDDLREAYGDALRAAQRRIDPRLSRALDELEREGATVESAAARAGLSSSRLTHLMSESLGPSPVAYRGWFKLRRALRAALVARLDLTRAAHEAGFADSAHLTRTTKHTMGVAPAAMLPPKVFLADEG